MVGFETVTLKLACTHNQILPRTTVAGFEPGTLGLVFQSLTHCMNPLPIMLTWVPNYAGQPQVVVVLL